MEDMPTPNTNNWKSSWQVFGQAMDLTKKIATPVAWLIGGQLLISLAGFFIGSLLTGESSIIASEQAPIYLIKFSIVAINFIYGLFLTFCVIYLARKPKLPLAEATKQAMKKLPAAIAVALIAGAIVTVSSFFFIIPGVIFYVYLTMSLFVLAMEDTGILLSIQRSFEYTSGLWWNVFARMILFIAILTFVTVFALIPGVGRTVTYVLSLLFVPVGIAYMTLTYQELVTFQKAKNTAKVSWISKLLLVLWAIVVFSLFSAVTSLSVFVKDVEGIVKQKISELNNS